MRILPPNYAASFVFFRPRPQNQIGLVVGCGIGQGALASARGTTGGLMQILDFRLHRDVGCSAGLGLIVAPFALGLRQHSANKPRPSVTGGVTSILTTLLAYCFEGAASLAFLVAILIVFSIGLIVGSCAVVTGEE